MAKSGLLLGENCHCHYVMPVCVASKQANSKLVHAQATDCYQVCVCRLRRYPGRVTPSKPPISLDDIAPHMTWVPIKNHTIEQHRAAFRHVFDTAVAEGWLQSTSEHYMVDFIELGKFMKHYAGSDSVRTLQDINNQMQQALPGLRFRNAKLLCYLPDGGRAEKQFHLHRDAFGPDGALDGLIILHCRTELARGHLNICNES